MKRIKILNVKDEFGGNSYYCSTQDLFNALLNLKLIRRGLPWDFKKALMKDCYKQYTKGNISAFTQYQFLSFKFSEYYLERFSFDILINMLPEKALQSPFWKKFYIDLDNCDLEFQKEIKSEIIGVVFFDESEF